MSTLTKINLTGLTIAAIAIIISAVYASSLHTNSFSYRVTPIQVPLLPIAR